MTPVSQNFLYWSIACRIIRSDRRSSSSFRRLTVNLVIGTSAPAMIARTAMVTTSSTSDTPESPLRQALRVKMIAPPPSRLLGRRDVDRHALPVERQSLGRRIEDRDVAEAQGRRPRLLGMERQIDEGPLTAHPGPAAFARQPHDQLVPGRPRGHQDEG